MIFSDAKTLGFLVVAGSLRGFSVGLFAFFFNSSPVKIAVVSLLQCTTSYHTSIPMVSISSEQESTRKLDSQSVSRYK